MCFRAEHTMHAVATAQTASVRCIYCSCLCVQAVQLTLHLLLECRLQIAGYHNRYICYTGSGFMEGVSLTHYDELMRWQK